MHIIARLRKRMFEDRSTACMPAGTHVAGADKIMHYRYLNLLMNFSLKLLTPSEIEDSVLNIISV